MNPNAAKPRIVVLGGGFGGLETAYALRSALPDRADITLISDRSYFIFRPNTIYIPFGLDEDKLHVDIVKPALRKGIRFIEARACDLDPVRRLISYQRDGKTETAYYDYLVIATGAAMRPEEIPGLRENAKMIGTPADMLKLRSALNRLLERAKYGKSQQVLLALPGHNRYSSPLYEMTFMIDRWLREMHVRDRVDITWATSESHYIEAFGPLLHDLTLQHFEERDIAHHTEYWLSRVDAGAAHFADGASLPFDLMITFPPYVAAAPFPALPSDDRGFLATHLASRRVKGLHEVFAAGDTTDFPVKQAFLALLQADAIAEGITAEIQGRQPRFVFEPVSKFVMEEFDTGVFAQAPFSPEGGLHVDVDSPQYKVGTSPLWRIGKKMLGAAVPWRFGQGEPFNAGLPSAGLEFGLKLMSGVMAAHHEPAPTI